MSRHQQLLVASALLLGIFVRSVHLLYIDWSLPFHESGLFLEFARQIAINNFTLPTQIPFYTDGGIPFAYPPLLFYGTAFLIHIVGLPAIPVANVLPPLLAIIALPLFHTLTRKLDFSPQIRLISLFVFAVLPIAFTQQIEAAGLAEAGGVLALLGLTIALAHAQQTPIPKNFMWIGLAWAGCIVTSPGPAYASAAIILAFALFYFSKSTLPRFAIALGVALLVSAPYWLTVINNHGISLIINSVLGQHESFSASASVVPYSQTAAASTPFSTDVKALGQLRPVIKLAFDIFSRLNVRITSAIFPFIYNGFLVVGIGLAVRTKTARYLVAWWLITLIIPREGFWMAAIPTALLIALGLSAFYSLLTTHHSKLKPLAMLLLLVYGLINAVYVVQLTASYSAGRTAATVEAMIWLRDNTPADAEIIVMYPTGWTREWVGYSAERTILNVPQGTEWKPQLATLISTLDPLMEACESLDCLIYYVETYFGKNDYYLYADVRWLAEVESDGLEVMWQNDGVIIGRITQQ